MECWLFSSFTIYQIVFILLFILGWKCKIFSLEKLHTFKCCSNPIEVFLDMSKKSLCDWLSNSPPSNPSKLHLPLQAPCENLRTPSTYPGNMLPHHPAQANFEDFTCWATRRRASRDNKREREKKKVQKKSTPTKADHFTRNCYTPSLTIRAAPRSSPTKALFLVHVEKLTQADGSNRIFVMFLCLFVCLLFQLWHMERNHPTPMAPLPIKKV